MCSAGETGTSCPADCDQTDPPEPSEPVCGDNVCEVGESRTCPADCDGTTWECGNGICEEGETYNSCSADCPAPPTDGDDDDDDDDGGGAGGGAGSSARNLLIQKILEQLIAVLQQLIALIIAQRGA